MKRFAAGSLLGLIISGVTLIGQPKPASQVPNSQLRTPGGSSTPIQTVTVFAPGMPNLFPIPIGKTVCIVSRNIPQAIGPDYTNNGGNVVFNVTPEVGDVIILTCF